MSRQSPLRTICELIIGVAVFALVTHTWLVMGLVVPVTVSGHSMAPTLDEPQRLLVDRTAFAWREPRRWEIVVFRSPQEASHLFVKRIFGLPGETVAIVDGQLRINGTVVTPPHDLHYELRYGDADELRTGLRLGPTEYFVLGDNGPVSDDSRNWLARPALDATLLLGRPLGGR